MYMTGSKQGSWETVKHPRKEKKEKKDAKPAAKDRLGVTIDPTKAVFAAFDRAFVDKPVQDEKASYQGAFAGLVDEAPAARSKHDEDASSSDDEGGPRAAVNGTAPGAGTAAGAAKVKQPKVKKPKVSVAQAAAGIDVAALQSWMADAQHKYSTNETAQLQALSDRLLSSFKEAKLDLAKLVATRGPLGASSQPAAEVPHGLMNALASFTAAMSEPALAAVSAQLTTAVVQEAAAAASQGAAAAGPRGKGKAGLPVMLAVILRTRPQVLVQASDELRAAGRQLTGSGRLPLLLWVIHQAAEVDPAVGVAVWVRVLLPQLLGIPELPGGGGAAAPQGSRSATAGKSISAEQLQPLDTATQAQALEYLASLLQQLGGAAAARQGSGDISLSGSVQPTVPGAAVELISRLVAGQPIAAAPAAAAPGAAGAAAAAGEGKKAVAARNAAAVGLTPLLPGLTALAASTTCGQQYTDWLLLAFESASLSAAAPDAPDALVERSASNVVACLCGSDACFSLWESKHKGQLKGSARILAAMLQRPQLLQPLLAQAARKEAFRGLLAGLPARHRTHLAAGKGWQGACAQVAEDACQKLPRKLGRGWGGAGSSGSSSRGGGLLPLLGVTFGIAGLLVMVGLHRREVAGIVSGYAGGDAAQALDERLLAPLEGAVLAGAAAAAPAYQQHVAPLVEAAWAAAAPVVGPGLEALRGALEALRKQLEEIDAAVRQSPDGVDMYTDVTMT